MKFFNIVAEVIIIFLIMTSLVILLGLEINPEETLDVIDKIEVISE